MRLLNNLFRRRRPPKSKLGGLFAMSTAYLTLAAQADLQPAGKAGLCFRPLESGVFDRAEREVRDVVLAGARYMNTRVEAHDDPYGFRWLVLDDPQFEDLVAAIHIAGQSMEEKGFRDQLLAAVFKFQRLDGPAYWIYNYKRGKFYPFVPATTASQSRDHPQELRLHSSMEKELPLEDELEQWYPLWGMPL
ncbi:MAG: hypothetical protein ACE5IZ_00235 [Dehalococcoidia bacterium]